MTAKDVLRISDLGKAAFLVTKGMRLVEAEQFENRVYLAFSNYEMCRSTLRQIEDNVPVCINDYLNAFTQVKSAMRDARDKKEAKYGA